MKTKCKCGRSLAQINIEEGKDKCFPCQERNTKKSDLEYSKFDSGYLDRFAVVTRRDYYGNYIPEIR